MKRLLIAIKIAVLVGFAGVTTSCEDIFTTDTNRYMLAQDNLISSPNDTVYSLLGILSKVQKLSDKYVLLGELRGDLMSVTPKADTYLRQVNDFQVDAQTNDLADVKDYYAVINNCNYFLSKADTNLVDKGRKPFLKEYRVVMTIRAWTYLQLALNYGSAYYYEKPILSLDDAKQNLPVFTPEQIIDTMIVQLKGLNPIVNNEIPSYGSIEGVQLKNLYLNTLCVLGDLYLWKASFSHATTDYEQAATYYAAVMLQEKMVIDDVFSVTYANDQFLKMNDRWSDIFAFTSSKEVVSMIKLAPTTSEGNTTKLHALCSELKLTPAAPYIENSTKQVYCYRDGVSSAPKYTNADLRVMGALKRQITYVYGKETEGDFYINKYLGLSVLMYRNALIYLRYAEAVNRIGKPSLAFAVLKYGLSNNTFTATDQSIKQRCVALSELADKKPYVTSFANTTFDLNVGVHNRGSGASMVNIFYTIPDFTRYITVDGKKVSTSDPAELALAKQDSINYVENAICDELALETSFEGNRFQDLMRMSGHKSDPTFLASKVSKKYTNSAEMFDLLKNKENWYMPVRKY